jgi:hypothetical protein
MKLMSLNRVNPPKLTVILFADTTIFFRAKVAVKNQYSKSYDYHAIDDIRKERRHFFFDIEQTISVIRRLHFKFGFS